MMFDLGAGSLALAMAGTMTTPVAPAQSAPQTAVPTVAPTAVPDQMTPAPAPVGRIIKTLRVEGSQRIEPETVLSYTKLRVGKLYSAETLDQALKDLQASDLFADYSIAGVEDGNIVLRVR